MEKVFTIFLVVRATVRVVVFVQWQHQQRRRRWKNFCRRGAPLSQHVTIRGGSLGIYMLRRVRWDILRHKFPNQRLGSCLMSVELHLKVTLKSDSSLLFMKRHT